jgi:L-malate glycosyltransferase
MLKPGNLSIAILSPGELFGGVETQVLSLCTRLREIGVNTLAVLFHDHELAVRLRESGLDPVILPVRHRYDPRAARLLVNALISHRTDVLHVHGYRAAVTAAVAGSRLTVAVVKTEHGRPEPGGTLIGRAKTRINRSLDIWAAHRLNAHVCYVTADLMHHFDTLHAGLDRRVLHNGIVPLSRNGRPRPAGLDPALFQAGVVGRISVVKGIRFALLAMSTSAVPDHVHLNIIGSGPEEDELRGYAGSHGLSGRVSFHGFQRDVMSWIAHLDALLLPSLHEGLPYTLLEAMSFGVPIVASRVGGLAEVLRHEQTGLLVEVGDIGGLARALAGLARDPELGRRLGSAAAQEQRDRYTLDRMVGDYLEVYSRVAGCK